MNTRDRDRLIEEAVSLAKKQFGQSSILRQGADQTASVQAISTRSLSLDAAIGIGGLPCGRFTEIYGPHSSGKTTLTLQVIAEVQRQGGVAAFLDLESALDWRYAGQLGVKSEELLVAHPTCAEDAIDIMALLVDTGALSVVVVDSVAALVPRVEIGKVQDARYGEQAALMSQALRRLAIPLGRCNTCVVFVNQMREKVDILFGDPNTTTGGRALGFYSSVRLSIRQMGVLKIGDVTVGTRTKVRVVKNKVAPPSLEAEFDMLFGQGVSREGELFDLGVPDGVIAKGDGGFHYRGEALGQNRAQVTEYLRRHADVSIILEAGLRARLIPLAKARIAVAAGASD